MLKQIFSILPSTESWVQNLNYSLQNIKLLTVVPFPWNMHGFWIKGTKEQNCWIKLFQYRRGLVKTFSILALTESFCHTVLLDGQLIDFLIWRKKCLVLIISRFLRFCEIHRFKNLWHHHIYYYIMLVTLLLISFES